MTSSKLRSTNKPELIDIANSEFGLEVDDASTREELIGLIEAAQEERAEKEDDRTTEETESETENAETVVPVSSDSDDYKPDTENAATEGDELVKVEVRAGQKVWHRDGVANEGDVVEMYKPHAEHFVKLDKVKYVKGS